MITSEELRAIAQDWEAGGSIHDALASAADTIDELMAENARLRKLDRIVGTCSICSAPIRCHE